MRSDSITHSYLLHLFYRELEEKLTNKDGTPMVPVHRIGGSKLAASAIATVERFASRSCSSPRHNSNTPAVSSRKQAELDAMRAIREGTLLAGTF